MCNTGRAISRVNSGTFYSNRLASYPQQVFYSLYIEPSCFRAKLGV